MTTGHFAVAAGSKPAIRTAPLWALMLSTYLLDLVFMVLVGTGLEGFAPLHPGHPGYGQVVIHAAYSHSLVGAAILAGAAGLLAGRAWGRRAGTGIAAVAFSHWLLDLIVHRPDLPLLPGNAGGLPLLGLGLWSHPAFAALLEVVLVAAGLTLYGRSAMRRAGPSPAQRRRATLAVAVTGALLGLLLIVDVAALPMPAAVALMLALVLIPDRLDRRIAGSRRQGHRRPVASATPRSTLR